MNLQFCKPVAYSATARPQLQFGSKLDELRKQREPLAIGETRFKELCDITILPGEPGLKVADFLAHLFEHGLSNEIQLTYDLALPPQNVGLLFQTMKQLALGTHVIVSPKGNEYALSISGLGLLKKHYPEIQLADEGSYYRTIRMGLDGFKVEQKKITNEDAPVGADFTEDSFDFSGNYRPRRPGQ